MELGEFGGVCVYWRSILYRNRYWILNHCNAMMRLGVTCVVVAIICAILDGVIILNGNYDKAGLLKAAIVSFFATSVMCAAMYDVYRIVKGRIVYKMCLKLSNEVLSFSYIEPVESYQVWLFTRPSISKLVGKVTLFRGDVEVCQTLLRKRTWYLPKGDHSPLILDVNIVGEEHGKSQLICDLRPSEAYVVRCEDVHLGENSQAVLYVKVKCGFIWS